ncbi:hypothetical protein [Pseudomonas sp. SID14000]|nr:hypothetical protein [Pseudomonas sp. SID14000]
MLRRSHHQIKPGEDGDAHPSPGDERAKVVGMAVNDLDGLKQKALALL